VFLIYGTYLTTDSLTTQFTDAYGNGAEAAVGQYGGAGQAGNKPFRGKMRGGAGRGRASSKPY